MVVCFTEPCKKNPTSIFRHPALQHIGLKKKSLYYLHLFTYYIKLHKCWKNITREYYSKHIPVAVETELDFFSATLGGSN